MTFTQAVASGLSNYVNFSSRAIRSEFWFWQLFLVVGAIAAECLDYATYALISHALTFSPLTDIFWFGTLLPSVAVAVRRLHDIDRSGWWYLLMFVPLIGAVVLIVWWCKRGSTGYNRFGADRLPAEVSLHGAGRSLRRADSASN